MLFDLVPILTHERKRAEILRVEHDREDQAFFLADANGGRSLLTEYAVAKPFFVALALLRELSNKSAASLMGGIYGNTISSSVIQNYRLLARYRRNFLREWLFFEVEPEITWPVEANGSRHETLAVILRLEVVFKGAARISDASSGAVSP
jgi:hypothetical protein